MIAQRVLSIRSEVLHKLAPFLAREARAHADMMKPALIVEEPEQQRSDVGTVTFLMPAETRNHAVAFPFVFDLQHHTLVGLIES